MDATVQQAPSKLDESFAALRHGFLRDGTPDYDLRLDRLQRLEQALEAYSSRLVEAMSQDFGFRSPIESENFDITISLGEIRAIKKNFKRWSYDRRVSMPLHLMPAKGKLIPQPLGVIGIISPWNFPVNLCITPLAAALAAGNRVMIKPSELTPRTSDLLHEMLSQAFSAEEVSVVLGDSEVAAAFSSLPFDHLLFTGSTSVGQKVYEAAAKNLTPVTLELGGKSPAIITPSADLQRVAKRIAWGKLANAGQICIAPDYALVPRDRISEFVDAYRAAVRSFYGSRDGASHFTSISNDKQYERLNSLLSEAKAAGAEVIELPIGTHNAPKRQLSPHVVLNVPLHIKLMQEEIFGPILPIIAYDSKNEALSIIQGKDHPLALYIFAEDKSDQDYWLKNTISGGVCINDTLMHVAADTLPFGGIGKSGIGAYHGQAGFDRFSHLKPVFLQSKLNGAFLFEPPFTGWKKSALKLLRRFI